MKKFIIILLLLATTMLSAKEDYPSDLLALTISLIDYMEDQQPSLEARGFETEFIALSDYGHVFPKSKSLIELELTKGTTYVFYVATDGPKVSVHCTYSGSKFNKDVCTEPSDRIMYFFRPALTGKYWFYIVSMDTGSGAHITCITKLNRKEKLNVSYE